MATSTFLGLTLTLSPTALTALRIAPAISSTASLTHAYMEWLTTSSFLGPAPVDSRMSRVLMGSEALAQPTNSTERVEAKTEVERDGKGKGKRKGEEEMRQAKQLVVPAWFTTFFNTGVISVVSLNTLTLLTASLNIHFSENLRGSKTFYQLGLASAVAHYAFVPLVGRSVRALVRLANGAKTEGAAVEWVAEWVGWHVCRMGTVDLVAWGCFVWGAVRALTV